MVARRVRCWPGLKLNRSRSSGGTTKRIELASAVSGTISATRSAWKCSAIYPLISPRRLGVSAGEELHHRENMAQMLAVMAASPADDRPVVRGNLELSLREDRRNRRAIFLL